MADKLGLAPDTPVISGVGDSNASLIGSGAVKDFEPIIYIGTTLYMTCHVPFKKTDLAHFMGSIPSPFPSRYYLMGEQGAGGKCVEFFLKNLIYPEDAFDTGSKPEDAYERFNAMASEAPVGSNGVIFLPWLNGSIVPKEVPHMRAGFINLSHHTTRYHMARAVFEGLAFNSRWTCGPLEKFIGQPVKSFRFSGGGECPTSGPRFMPMYWGFPSNRWMTRSMPRSGARPCWRCTPWGRYRWTTWPGG